MLARRMKRPQPAEAKSRRGLPKLDARDCTAMPELLAGELVGLGAVVCGEHLPGGNDE